LAISDWEAKDALLIGCDLNMSFCVGKAHYFVLSHVTLCAYGNKISERMFSHICNMKMVCPRYVFVCKCSGLIILVQTLGPV
jgi:hypothetical protein